MAVSSEINNYLAGKLSFLSEHSNNKISGSPVFYVEPENLEQAASILKSEPDLYFDMLSCITGLHRLAGEKHFIELNYHFYSIPFNSHCELFLSLESGEGNSFTREVPSLEKYYKTALWQEREIYEMYGLRFSNHPDLRNLLLPADWQGFPLRKDYKQAEQWHGIKVAM